MNQAEHAYDYITDEIMEDLEFIFREIFLALSNPDRIRFLKYINRKGAITPKELKANFFLENCTVTHHLNILRKTGLVINEGRTGRCIYYRINQNFLGGFVEDFFSYIGLKATQLTKKEGVSYAG